MLHFTQTLGLECTLTSSFLTWHHHPTWMTYSYSELPSNIATHLERKLKAPASHTHTHTHTHTCSANCPLPLWFSNLCFFVNIIMIRQWYVTHGIKKDNRVWLWRGPYGNTE